jgi:hypothetical protein
MMRRTRGKTMPVAAVVVLLTLVSLTAQVAAQGRSDQALARVMNIHARHTTFLMTTPGVMGTGVGYNNAAGEPAIIVYVQTPADTAGLPHTLDGVPVVVKVTGMIVARTDPTARQLRPVPTGVSTGHPEITAGTIGCRVQDAAGNVFALSNNHVLANSNDASIGDSALQPGPFDGGIDPDDKIGELFDFEPIDFSGGNNTIDAAIASTSTAWLDYATPSDDGYGAPHATTVTAFVGLPVQKYGRTTKLTHGEVSEINVTVDVCYECSGPSCFNCNKLARFVDQIGISPGDFSAGGDSGSLIVTDDGSNDPVGLLFAGGSTRTFANPIDRILNRFDVTVDDGSPEPAAVTDIAVSDVGAPAAVLLGALVDVDVTIQNVGNQDVASDITVTLTDDTDGVLSETQTIAGGLTAGASTTLTYQWNAIVALAGDSILTASHDFTDEDAHNDAQSTVVAVIEPSTGVFVDRMTPDTMQAGTATNVTISGLGFVPGASVTFEIGQGQTPTASNVDVVEGTTIEATVTTGSGGPPQYAVWDVRVTNPDGSSGVLPGGFIVTP